MKNQQIKRTVRCLQMCVVSVLMCVAIVSTLGAVEPETSDRILAIVNNDIILLSELNQELKPFIEKIKTSGSFGERERAALYKVREDMLNRLIDNKLRDQEIERFGITIGESAIDNAIEQIKKANLYTDEELRIALSQSGLSIQDYRKRVKEQLLRSNLVTHEITSKIIITKEEVSAYYNSHRGKYGGKTEYHLRNIVMMIPSFSSEAMQLEIKEKMEAIRERLKNGESFEKMAREYSQSRLAAQGGDLGLLESSSLSTQIRSAIIELKPGQYTQVLQTDQGYQIFYIEDIIKTPDKSLEEISEEIEAALYNEVVNKKYLEWIEKLRKRAHIKIIR